MTDRTIIFKERPPRYVFNGEHLERSTLLTVQWVARLMTIGAILAAIFLIFIHKPIPGENLSALYLGDSLLCLAAVIFYYKSEVSIQKQLDGNTRLEIFEDGITIPSRLHRRLIGISNVISKDEIDHFEIVRGSGYQYVANRNGVHWVDSPIDIKIVLKNGKKLHSGYKPPNTVQAVMSVLKDRWNISIIDSGQGLGRGRRYIGNMVIGEYSYDEIMRMNLFEWQE